MRSIRNITLSALLTFGAFSLVTFTACNPDECKDVVCNNGGACDEATGNCNCPTGYEGTSCETLSRTKFVGSWTGSDVCSSGTYTVTMTIGESTNDVNALITNPAGFGTNITITGKISSTNELTFTNQTAGGNGRVLNGKMTISGNALTFEYTVVDADNDTDNCTGTYAKD